MAGRAEMQVLRLAWLAQDDKQEEQRVSQERLTFSDDFLVFSLELAEDHRGGGDLSHGRRLHGAAGAQAGGPYPESVGTQPRGTVRAAAAAGGWSEIVSQRRPDSEFGLQASLPAGSADFSGERADFDRCGAVRGSQHHLQRLPVFRDRGYQRGAAGAAGRNVGRG